MIHIPPRILGRLMPRILGSLIMALFLAGFMAEHAEAEPLTIGRMRVAIWPEYDNPGTLVTYDGRFTDPTAFPAKSRFLVPKDITISDACSLSPTGQHFCQLFEISEKDGWDEIELWLPFPNFYLSFHLPHGDPQSDNPQSDDLQPVERILNYPIKSNHTIETMEVDIQQPLRSDNFSIVPDNGQQSVKQGFNHFSYTLNNLVQGAEPRFEVRYQKQDRKPSIDIKYATMTGPKVWGSPYEDQKKASTLITIMFGSGVVSLCAIIGFFLWKRRRAT